MSHKLLFRTGWVISGLLALLFAMSAFFKLSQNAEALTQAAASGFNARTYLLIGVVEVIALVLFLIPRTGIAGTLLLAAYMGGAIATHLQHQQPIAIALVVETLIWIAAVLRFPELRQRLFVPQTL